jgi:lipoprotein signal peptidase
MSELAAALSSREGSAILFVGCTVFAVISLTVFRGWLERGPRAEKSATANLIAAALGAIFAAMLAGGVADYVAAGAVNFLNLALFLTGAAGAGILAETIIGFHRGTLDNDELRRMAAHDL